MTLPKLKEAYGKRILMPCKIVHRRDSFPPPKKSQYTDFLEKAKWIKKDTGTHLRWEFWVFQNTTQETNVFLDFQPLNFVSSM